MLNQINDFFGIFVSYLAPVLFMSIKGFPLIVLVLLFGALIILFGLLSFKTITKSSDNGGCYNKILSSVLKYSSPFSSIT